MHTYVYELRRCFRAQADVPGSAVLSTEGRGYLLHAEQVDSDLDDFDGLCDEAARALAGSDDDATVGREEMETASTLLAQALAMWTGDPFVNVSCGAHLESHAMWLRERKAQALGTRLRTDLALGRSASLIAELKILTQQDPFQEELSELLMLALARSGRRSDALREFGILRSRLIDELGLEPGKSLQDLQQALLRGSVEPVVPPWTAIPAQRSAGAPAVKHVWHPPRSRHVLPPPSQDNPSWRLNHLRFD